MCAYLLHDPVDLAVLGVDLVAHVQGHVAQVTNDATHLLQVLIHLIFPGIVCYPTIQKVTFNSAGNQCSTYRHCSLRRCCPDFTSEPPKSRF